MRQGGEPTEMSSLVEAGDRQRVGGVGDVHVVEVNEAEEGSTTAEIAPLLVEVGHRSPRMTIFSVSYPKNRPSKELTPKAAEAEITFLCQIIMWAWSGSRYSGILCMATSATIYYIMEVLMDNFPGQRASYLIVSLGVVPWNILLYTQSIPLFETVFTRCTIISILSVVWLRRTGQPLFSPVHIRNLLVIRSVTGFISLLGFIYSIQNLPLAYAVVLNLATPIMASIGAKIILQENWALPDIGGLASSFLGLLFIFLPILAMRGGLNEFGETSNTASSIGRHAVFAILVGIFSSAIGGISYCLIRAGSKESDHPVYTVFSFGVLASPVSAICTFALQEFILPNFFTLFKMILLGVLAFFAEMSLARGLQLEKISKVTNILYIKVLLSRVWSMTFFGTGLSFSELIGCLLIVVSVSCTLYLGPDKGSE